MSKQQTMTKNWSDNSVIMHDLNNLTLRVDDFPEAMQKRFALHGLIQKVRDALAGMSVKKGYTVADREEAAMAVVQHLMDNSWFAPGSERITKEEGIKRLMAQEDMTRTEAEHIWDILHKSSA